MGAFAAVVFALAVLAAAGAGAQEAKTRIGTIGSSPPFNYIDKNGQLAGFDIEIGNALCAAAKMACEWQTQERDGIIPGLRAEKYDLVIASLSMTGALKREVDFTDRYYQKSARFVGPAKRRYMTIESATLAGKTIGARKGTYYDDYLTDLYTPLSTIVRYNTLEQAVLDLAAGKIDLLLDDAVELGTGFLKSELGRGFVFVGAPISAPQWFGAGIGIAVRKGDDKLRLRLNRALQNIRANGTYEKINNKFFEFDIFGS
ncbi:MAG: transporter substrate-binding domain-containing protein [Alphaproteobacteria bacterium]